MIPLITDVVPEPTSAVTGYPSGNLNGTLSAAAIYWPFTLTILVLTLIIAILVYFLVKKKSS